MAAILNIDTAIETASVCLARDAQSLQLAMNTITNDHAAWLHPAIQKMMAESGCSLHQLDAIAITIGPGSYTGLRVGLAAAKGLCIALNIPLIAINTLEVMAYAVKDQEADLLCPLIDARRMEVFMAIYDKNIIPVKQPVAMVVDAASFDSLLASNRIIFSGSGSKKLKPLIPHPNAVFCDVQATAADMIHLSQKCWLGKKFADITYSEPHYIKEFYTVRH